MGRPTSEEERFGPFAPWIQRRVLTLFLIYRRGFLVRPSSPVRRQHFPIIKEEFGAFRRKKSRRSKPNRYLWFIDRRLLRRRSTRPTQRRKMYRLLTYRLCCWSQCRLKRDTSGTRKRADKNSFFSSYSTFLSPSLPVIRPSLLRQLFQFFAFSLPPKDDKNYIASSPGPIVSSSIWIITSILILVM